MCSSWYFLKYASPNSGDSAFRPEEIKHWLPVDQYTGGAEHAVMHLLYARFFVKALRDIGLLDFDEPFVRLYNQGIIISDRQKMSKSRGNVITPDEYVDTVGADVVRGYLMFIGPWDQGGEWVDQGINGIVRWYNRVWDLVERDEPELGPGKSSKPTIHMLHKTTKKVYQDLDRFHFNTALASLMEFTNHLARALDEGSVDGEDLERVDKGVAADARPNRPPHDRGAVGGKRLRIQHSQSTFPSMGRRPRRRGRGHPRFAGQRKGQRPGDRLGRHHRGRGEGSGPIQRADKGLHEEWASESRLRTGSPGEYSGLAGAKALAALKHMKRGNLLSRFPRFFIQGGGDTSPRSN